MQAPDLQRMIINIPLFIFSSLKDYQQRLKRDRLLLDPPESVEREKLESKEKCYQNT
jgi:hypothetical protein